MSGCELCCGRQTIFTLFTSRDVMIDYSRAILSFFFNLTRKNHRRYWVGVAQLRWPLFCCSWGGSGG
jgi:hypothetical protein